MLQNRKVVSSDGNYHLPEAFRCWVEPTRQGGCLIYQIVPLLLDIFLLVLHSSLAALLSW